MEEIKFPLKMSFKILTLTNQIKVTDVEERVIAYVHQKMFKLKEEILVFSDETKQNLKYTIKADRIIDFSAVYTFYDRNNVVIGKIRRKGMKSIWKAYYEIVDPNDNLLFTIREANPWAKVFDSMFGGLVSVFFFHPKYNLIDNNNQIIVELEKKPAFFEGKFEMKKNVMSISQLDQERIILANLMLVLLERQRG